jgi:large subunit ribosomal protein L25
MADVVNIATQPRGTRGSRAARRLRKQGLIPVVVYGHQQGTVSLAVPGEEMEKVVRRGVHVLDLQTGGATEKVLIRDLQWDHLGKELLHVDFARVAADERVVVTVPVEVRGALAVAGGVVDQPLHSLAIECPVVEVPESIRVNLSGLQVGAMVHVRDLVLPPNVKVMADPDAVVVHVIAKQVEAEAPAAAPAAEGVEPELIGRQKAVEDEEGAPPEKKK